MLRTILIFILSCATLLAAGDSLRVMTYNIQGMKPGTEPHVRIIHIIDKLIEIDPDIIGLQEINESINGTGADNQAKVIADSLSAYFGIPYYYYNQQTHLSWSSQFREFIGIITKHPVEETGFFQLVTGAFPRKVVWNKINTPLGTVNFFNTHLSFNSASVRTVQVQQIISYIESIEPDHPAIATILTGDFNDVAGAQSIQQLINTGTDTFYVRTYVYVNPGSLGYTIPSNAPTSKIDYVFLKNTASIAPFESSVVMNQPYNGTSYCSDHLGVLTSFRDGVLDVDDESFIYPDEFRLFQNYPNPFNPVTKIRFSIPQDERRETQDVNLKVYDSLGNEIAILVNEEKPAGIYEVEFSAKGGSASGGNAYTLPSGIYFYRLQTGEYTDTKKFVLMK
jgi:endonuclease/exonuclease/phosphatase family metal-dependent hydrolase